MKPFIHLKSLFATLGAVAGLSSCASVKSAGAAREQLESLARRQDGLAVLFVGNSFSIGVPGEFEKIAEAHGRTVSVDQSTHDGWTLARHASDRETMRKIRARRWDVVVIQEQSRIPTLGMKRRWAMFPNVRLLAAEARRQGAVPLLCQTWGYLDGDPQIADDNLPAMTRRLREGYRAAAENAGGLPVAPVGDAWEGEFKAGHGEGLFHEDRKHPSAAGNALSAKVIFRTLVPD